MNDRRRPHSRTTLLIGFDSAWTFENRGALIGVFREEDGTLRELTKPQTANFTEAADAVSRWRSDMRPGSTIVLIDQPTIVTNAAGQRPVENLVASSVSLRYGGMRPANTVRAKMFGPEAPVWQFLKQFGGAANPLSPTWRYAGVRNVPSASNESAWLGAAR